MERPPGTTSASPNVAGPIRLRLLSASSGSTTESSSRPIRAGPASWRGPKQRRIMPPRSTRTRETPDRDTRRTGPRANSHPSRATVRTQRPARTTTAGMPRRTRSPAPLPPNRRTDRRLPRRQRRRHPGGSTSRPGTAGRPWSLPTGQTPPRTPTTRRISRVPLPTSPARASARSGSTRRDRSGLRSPVELDRLSPHHRLGSPATGQRILRRQVAVRHRSPAAAWSSRNTRPVGSTPTTPVPDLARPEESRGFNQAAPDRLVTDRSSPAPGTPAPEDTARRHVGAGPSGPRVRST